jgi:hypothetical protein
MDECCSDREIEGLRPYHKKAMFGKPKMLNDFESSINSTILVHGSDDSLKGAGNLCRHDGAFIAEDTDTNAKIITPPSEAVIAQQVVAQCRPVA